MLEQPGRKSEVTKPGVDDDSCDVGKMVSYKFVSLGFGTGCQMQVKYDPVSSLEGCDGWGINNDAERIWENFFDTRARSDDINFPDERNEVLDVVIRSEWYIVFAFSLDNFEVVCDWVHLPPGFGYGDDFFFCEKSFDVDRHEC